MYMYMNMYNIVIHILLSWIQEMEVSENPSLRRDTSDPTLICTAYKKNRFYLFTRKDPDDVKGYVHSTCIRQVTRGQAKSGAMVKH